MKQLLAIGLFCVAGWAWAAAADEAFSKTVGAGDFSAAGLSKLTPAELSRLDALVRDYRSGALVAAQREAAEARAVADAKIAKAEADAQAARIEAQKSEVARAEAAKKAESGGLLSRAKVLLTPGTEIEYATTESRIVGDFKGWEGNTVYTLENGQRWKIANGGLYSTPPVPSPKVKIVPSPLGGFWMTIDGIDVRVRVLPVVAK